MEARPGRTRPGRCGYPLGGFCPPARSGPHHPGRGAGEQLSVREYGRPATTPGRWPSTAVSQHKGLLLLGSATPAVESRVRRQRRDNITCLPCSSATMRISLPKVVLADMKQELRAGNNAGVIRAAPAGAGGKPASGESRASSFSTAGAAAAWLLCSQCGEVPTVPALLGPPDLPQRQRAAHVPLLRLLHAPAGGLPPLRRAGSSSWAWAPSSSRRSCKPLYPDVEVMRMDADTITATRLP